MSFRLDSAIAVLSRTPVVLDHWLRGLPSEWLTANEGEGTWSPFDVVGHLIDGGEETDWMPRARIILGKAGHRRFEPFDMVRHIERNRARALESLLDEFTRLRGENLASPDSGGTVPHR
ncbi:MAG: DinB family protein [Gemmatimonadota bacterium]|nr:DinB family protein [Gemmatimonadota bacterium]MDH4349159.1 DinB family protein [Gemmatimonadota bacterium]